MAQRGVNNSLELVHYRVNDGFQDQDENIYENQESVKQHLNNRQQQLVGKGGSQEQYQDLKHGSNPPNQETYEVFDADKQNYVPENYEPLQSQERQTGRNDVHADVEDYKEVYLTVLESNNNSSPLTDKPTRAEYGNCISGNPRDEEELYDDVVPSKMPKKRGKVNLGEKSLVKNIDDYDESDYKEKKSHHSKCVSTKSFRCCSLIILLIFLIAVSALVLVMLIIHGIINIKGINTCGCTEKIKKLEEQISTLQAYHTATTTTKATIIPTTKMNLTTVNSTIAPTQSCPPGWRNFQNSCYYMSKTSTNLSNANKSCIVLQSTLVSIETKAENDFITSTYLKCYPASYVSRAWLGLTYQGNISTRYPLQNYKWDSGQSINNSSSSFVNQTGLFTNNCFRVQQDKLWYPASCSEGSAVICEGPAGKVSSCYVP